VPQLRKGTVLGATVPYLQRRHRNSAGLCAKL
jgi:hypothetical protein